MVRVFNLFSENGPTFPKHSMIPMPNAILRGVDEVTFFDRTHGKGRFGHFLLCTGVVHRHAATT